MMEYSTQKYKDNSKFWIPVMGLAVLLLGTWFAFLLGANDQSNQALGEGEVIPGIGGGPGLNSTPSPTPTPIPSMPSSLPSDAPILIIPSPTSPEIF